MSESPPNTRYRFPAAEIDVRAVSLISTATVVFIGLFSLALIRCFAE